MLVTHENPDGDALGSLVAMQAVLRRARARTRVMYIAPRRVPAALRVRVLRVRRASSRDVARTTSAQRTIVFLDCGNFDRNAVEIGDAPILNIDHHHDNTRFGTVNLVDDHGLLHRRDRLGR